MVALLFWVAFIFGTSCTVVRPLEFFAMVQQTLGLDEEAMSRFRLFWGISWFTIVKGWHFTEFAILTGLTAKGLQWWNQSQSITTIGLAMLACVAFAASDEWHQTFVPDRFGTLTDVLIDSLGVLVMGGVLIRRQRKFDRSAAID
ncbi:MAG: VanZ family protein [Planctomycetaceae bacterium]|nr:VanZ family protein [Planctomycetaceae bacterium]